MTCAPRTFNAIDVLRDDSTNEATNLAIVRPREPSSAKTLPNWQSRAVRVSPFHELPGAPCRYSIACEMESFASGPILMVSRDGRNGSTSSCSAKTHGLDSEHKSGRSFLKAQ